VLDCLEEPDLLDKSRAENETPDPRTCCSLLKMYSKLMLVCCLPCGL